MRLLVTGSNGFIGSRIVTDALARGWKVTGVGRRNVPTVAASDYLQHDLSEPLELEQPVDAIIHAAGLATPWAPPQQYQRDNVRATELILDWAEHHGHPFFAYVSSSSVLYQDADQTDLTEDSPIPADQDQINTYSLTKLLGERLTAQYSQSWAILRPRAVFGVGDTVLLPRVVAAARKGVLPRFTRRDGHRIMADLTPVATISHYLLEAVADQVAGTFNLTNGEAVELNPFVDEVLARLELDPRRPEIPVGLAMGLAKAAEVVSARFLHYAEPPITRYGVSMFAHSKTFNPSHTQAALGQPPVSIAETLDELIRDLHG